MAEEEFLRHAVEELDALDPQPEEEAALDVSRRLMQGAERIREDVTKAAAAVGYKGAEGLVNDATRWLDFAADQAEGRLAAPLEALIRAQDALSDAQQGIEAALSGLSYNPTDLEQTEERLFAIRALARKHEVQPDDLGAFADTLRAKINALDQGAGEVAELTSALSKQELLYAEKASKLTAKRRKAAGGFGQGDGQGIGSVENGARGVHHRSHRHGCGHGWAGRGDFHGGHQSGRAFWGVE